MSSEGLRSNSRLVPDLQWIASLRSSMLVFVSSRNEATDFSMDFEIGRLARLERLSC